MTARDFLVEKNVFETSEICPFNLVLYRDGHVKTQKGIEKSMLEFAKLKCEELLKIVAEEARIKQEIEYIHSSVGYGSVHVIDKDSILNAIDLNEFIK